MPIELKNISIALFDKKNGALQLYPPPLNFFLFMLRPLSFDFDRKEHGVSYIVATGLGINKKIRGGVQNCSALFLLSKSAVKIFFNSLDNVLHPERGVKLSFDA